MFQSGMKEGLTSTVEMPDMTEAGIRALLAYLYCWDILAALQNSSVAFELLQAADKYGIPALYKIVKEVILLKETNRFSVTTSLQLLSFAMKKEKDSKGLDDWIEIKAMTALNS